MTTPFYTRVPKRVVSQYIDHFEEIQDALVEAFTQVNSAIGQGGLRQTHFYYSPNEAVFPLEILSPPSTTGVMYYTMVPDIFPYGPVGAVFCSGPDPYIASYFMKYPEGPNVLFDDDAFSFIFGTSAGTVVGEYSMQVLIYDTTTPVPVLAYDSGIIPVPVDPLGLSGAFAPFPFPSDLGQTLNGFNYIGGRLFQFSILYYGNPINPNLAGHGTILMKVK